MKFFPYTSLKFFIILFYLIIHRRAPPCEGVWCMLEIGLNRRRTLSIKSYYGYVGNVRKGSA